MGFVKVAAVNELKDGEGKAVQAGGKAIALFKQGGKFHAIDNTCIHQGGPLGEGSLEGTTVTCPWHGWQYNIATGDSTVMPGVKVRSYKVKVEGSSVLVDV